MTNRYLKQTGYLPAIKLEKFFSTRKAEWMCLLCLVMVILSGVAFVFGVKSGLSAGEFFLAVFICGLIYSLFLEDLKAGRMLTEQDLKIAAEESQFDKFLTFKITQLLSYAAFGDQLSVPRFVRILLKDKDFLWGLKHLNLEPVKFGTRIKEAIPENFSIDLNSLLAYSLSRCFGSGRIKLGIGDLLNQIAAVNKEFTNILFEFDVKEKDIAETFAWKERIEQKRRNDSRFWSKERLSQVKGIGKDWSAGFALSLNQLTEDLTLHAEFQKVPKHFYGHKKYVSAVQEALIHYRKPILVGDPGSGKHTVLQALAAAMNWGKTFPQIRYHKLLQLNSSAILLNSRNLNETLGRIKLLFSQAIAAGNVVLVINDIDALFDDSQEAGRVNAAEALLPYFNSSLNIIGITTQHGFQTTIGRIPEFLRMIEKIEVKETDAGETLVIIQDEATMIEAKTRLTFTNFALKEIVALSKMIPALPNPEKSLQLLEDVAVNKLREAKSLIILPEDVRRVVSAKTKIPLESVGEKEKDKLLHLEDLLHRRVVGQDQAISEVANALRRARAGTRSEDRPIGTFLFLGPTGVGKTETAKALAAAYFGSEQRMIRFDMSEFQEVHSISRLIGNADTKEGGILTEAALTNPYSLLLFDEIEKAHPKVLDLFLQLLDEGRLTDALGRTINFCNTMVIATSNAGSELIREQVANQAFDQEAILSSIQQTGIFRPEFLNRFDGIIFYRPLTSEELMQVANLVLQDLNRRLEPKEVQVRITPELVKFIVDKSYHPQFGARPLRRFVQDTIESHLARGLIAGEIKRGDVVEVQPEKLVQN